MKRKVLFFMALLAIVGSAKAQTFGLGTSEVTIKQGLSAELQVNFADDEEKYTAGNITLALPEGISVSDATFYSERDYLDEGGNAHTVTVGSPDESNKVKLMVASTSGNLIYQDVTNESDLLFTINLKASVDIAPGRYSATVSGIRFAEPYEEALGDRYQDFAPISFDIVVEEGDIVTLDENGTVPPVAKADVSVVLKRTMRTGGWNTLCLPFQLTAAKVKELFGDNTKVCQFNNATIDAEGNVTIAFTNWTRALAKNTPYLINPGESGTSYVIEGVSIEPEDVSLTKGDVTFIGTYVGGNAVPTGDYYLSEDKFYRSAGLSTIGGYRGYFHVDASSGARIRLNIDGKEGDATGIEHLIVTDGDEPLFDLNGHRVVTPRKGIYVRDGKKVTTKKK